jgi:hypothetical protein
MEKFLEEFDAWIDGSEKRLRAIPDEEASHQPPGKWSPKQILGHLIDSAANNHHRFVKAHFTDDLICSEYDQERWVSVQKYNNEAWTNLITLWVAYNRHLLHVVSVMPEEILGADRKQHNLDQVAFKPVGKEMSTTLKYFVEDYADHMRHHLIQIFEKQFKN